MSVELRRRPAASRRGTPVPLEPTWRRRRCYSGTGEGGIAVRLRSPRLAAIWPLPSGISAGIVPQRHRTLSAEDERIIRQDGRDGPVNPSLTLESFGWKGISAMTRSIRRGGRAVIDVLNSLLGMALGLLVGLAPVVVFGWWQRRDHRRWEREQQMRQQLWEVEQQIWRESLPAWQREAMEAADWTRGEIKQEARRRMGLPEEESRD